jgi:hypothetical protein
LLICSILLIKKFADFNSDQKEFVRYEAEILTAIKKYRSYLLCQSIKEAFSKGVITSNERNELDKFKKNFRDTFSHFDHQWLLPNEKVQLFEFSLDEIGAAKSLGSINMKAFDLDFAEADSL